LRTAQARGDAFTWLVSLEARLILIAYRIAQARGDAFTWLVSLEARAGALASMHSFITSCPELLTEDIVRRLTVPIEAALNLLTLLSGMTHHHDTVYVIHDTYYM
jgi:hypothetical protein